MEYHDRIVGLIYYNYRNTSVIHTPWEISDQLLCIKYNDGTPLWELWEDFVYNLTVLKQIHDINLLTGAVQRHLKDYMEIKECLS